MDFEARTDAVDGRALVRIRGELDLATAPLLEAALGDRGDRPQVVVDASELAFVDVVGLETLLRCHRRLVAEGGGLLVQNPSGALRRVLELTGLDGSLPVDGR